jgi:4-amino-4-deoxy-L-arabinose transferase-like glycosyltransferase
MKVLPFDYSAYTSKPFWSLGGFFLRYQPDFIITVLNQVLLFVVTVLIFLLARRLFDNGVAWVSAILFLCTDLFWRFSVSGLSTMFVLVIFMGLVWSLVLLEAQTRKPAPGQSKLMLLAVLTGALVGIGALTRYSFGWLIFPVVLFLILFSGSQRVPLTLIALAAFVAIMAPWIIRNYHVSGTPFGTAGYAVLENTGMFPENRLQRSLEPDLNRLAPYFFWSKLGLGLRQILLNDLPKLGGNWVSALFFVGLLIGFRSPAIRRLRYFLLASMVILTVVQAMGRTPLSDRSPEVNSENLLVILSPLFFVYGVSLFFLFLDQIQLPVPELRRVVIGIFTMVTCLPMLLTFMPPKPRPVIYPPYYPPFIQTVTGWLKERELVMSDIPWAVAWYGERQSVLLTLRATPDSRDPTSREDFFAINDYQKPINVLYLTAETMDSLSLTQWIRAGEQSWGLFILRTMVKRELPPDFPLRKSLVGWLPEQLVLADWERWDTATRSP